MTDPTDPTTAAATIRRAATVMRDVANAALAEGWEGAALIDVAVQGGFCIGVSGALAPNTTTPVQQWIADVEAPEFADHIALWDPRVALLVADVLDVLADDIVRTTNEGELHGLPPAEWTAAYNLAVGFLAVRPEGD